MHLDTVFTMLDRDAATAYPQVMDERPGDQPAPREQRTASSTSPRRTASSAPSPMPSGVAELRVVETGGDAYQQEREQWDDGNNVVALEPGRGRGLRAQHLHDRQDARGRRRGDHDRGVRARQGPRWRPLHDLSARAGPAVRAAMQTLRWVVAVVAASCVIGLIG